MDDPVQGNEQLVQDAQKYQVWQAHHQQDEGWMKVYDDLSHMLPGWFLVSSLLVGVFTLGLVMLRFNPVLAPVRSAIIWLFESGDHFLRGTKKHPKKKLVKIIQ